MRKIFFPALLATAFLFSCGNEVKKEKADSIESKKGMSVSEPLSEMPVAVDDTVFNGTSIKRHPNGVIKMRGEVAGGFRTGEWVSFYPSGKEWSRGTYKNGYREGYGVSYWQNGAKSSEGYYEHNKMVGVWKWWDEEGRVVEKDFGGKK